MRPPKLSTVHAQLWPVEIMSKDWKKMQARMVNIWGWGNFMPATQDALCTQKMPEFNWSMFIRYFQILSTFPLPPHQIGAPWNQIYWCAKYLSSKNFYKHLISSETWFYMAPNSRRNGIWRSACLTHVFILLFGGEGKRKMCEPHSVNLVSCRWALFLVAAPASLFSTQTTQLEKTEILAKRNCFDLLKSTQCLASFWFLPQSWHCQPASVPSGKIVLSQDTNKSWRIQWLQCNSIVIHT